MTVLVFAEALLDKADQLAQVVPLHLGAFRMEVEPSVPDSLISK